MAREIDPFKLSSPGKYLVAMAVFMALVGFVGVILLPSIQAAFMANPGLNGLIIGVFAIGVIMAVRQPMKLYREIRWINSYRTDPAETLAKPAPPLVGPMASLLARRNQGDGVPAEITRSILDSIGARLDETRDVLRYITGLLIFLGLLGTFWGLQETVGSVGSVIQSMRVGGDNFGAMFDELKAGLAAPLSGMGTAFAASLFGLAGSLVLGFLDLQGGQAQSRFYAQLEDWLSTLTEASGGRGEGPRVVGLDVSDFRAQVDRLSRLMTDNAAGGASAVVTAQSRAATAAMADLAEGIQGLVQHMRAEQQMIRQWVEAQADEQKNTQRLIESLMREREPERTTTGRGFRG